VQTRRLRIMKPTDNTSLLESAKFATCDFGPRCIFEPMRSRQRSRFGENLGGTGVGIGTRAKPLRGSVWHDCLQATFTTRMMQRYNAARDPTDYSEPRAARMVSFAKTRSAKPC
jgi:hypothetical protein